MFKHTLILIIGSFLAPQTKAVNFIIKNNEAGSVWVGILGNPGHPHLSNGGLILNPGQEVTVGAPDNWAGRFWGRTWCDPNTNKCLTGDCGKGVQCNGAGGKPPASLAEITLKGHEGLDFYDISFVDGFNLKISMEPINGQGDGSQYSCKKCGCSVNLNDKCPEKLRVVNDQGQTIACKSACEAFNTDEYCCRGAHNTADTCRSTDWPQNYPKYFKDNCPDGYSYAYDDHKSTFTCKASTYRITFG